MVLLSRALLALPLLGSLALADVVSQVDANKVFK